MKLKLGTYLIAAMICGCAQGPVIDAPSRNQNSRINYLVIHFTTENFADSLALLTEPSDNPVSAHYLIPEPYDATYRDRKLRIFRLVDEAQRAWHAGASYWNGEKGLNNRSIGIELVNRSYCTDDPASDSEDQYCFFPDFADPQIGLLIELARDILARNPDIDPTEVVGHADIAPDRKVDPGPRFPWELLYRAGIGAWYDNDAVLRYRSLFRHALPSLRTVQSALSAYGYRIEPTGADDEASRDVVRAFQMHFVPSAVSGEVDLDTAAALFSLIEKYRPERLDDLLEVRTPDRSPQKETPLTRRGVLDQ